MILLLLFLSSATLTTASYYHVQSVVNAKCGISYSTPSWSSDVATAPRSLLMQDLAANHIDIFHDYERFYPNPECQKIPKAWIEVAALYPLLARLPLPKNNLTKLQRRSIFMDAANLKEDATLAVATLTRFGVVVLDNIIPQANIIQLEKEAASLYDQGHFQRAKTLAAEHLVPIGHTGSGGLLLPSFRSDEFYWLDQKQTVSRSAEQHFRQQHLRIMQHLMERINKANSSLLPSLHSFTEPLLTRYDKGARYGAHVDSSDHDTESQLSISCLMYLSENPVCGALRVGLLNPGRTSIDDSLDIHPKMGRLVLFLSKHVPHEVQQTWSPRYTLTSFLRSSALNL